MQSYHDFKGAADTKTQESARPYQRVPKLLKLDGMLDKVSFLIGGLFFLHCYFGLNSFIVSTFFFCPKQQGLLTKAPRSLVLGLGSDTGRTNFSSFLFSFMSVLFYTNLCVTESQIPKHLGMLSLFLLFSDCLLLQLVVLLRPVIHYHHRHHHLLLVKVFIFCVKQKCHIFIS